MQPLEQLPGRVLASAWTWGDHHPVTLMGLPALCFWSPGSQRQHPFTIIALLTWGPEPEPSSPACGRPSSTAERTCRPASSPPFPEPLSNRAGWDAP